MHFRKYHGVEVPKEEKKPLPRSRCEKRSQPSLKVFQWNARGWKKNKTELLKRAEQNDADVLLLQESNLGSGEEIPFGICVWSTGNRRTEFVNRMEVSQTRDQRIQIDDQLKVIFLYQFVL